MVQALIHSWARPVFRTSGSGFFRPAIATFETQFSTQTRVRIDQDAEAHEAG